MKKRKRQPKKQKTVDGKPIRSITTTDNGIDVVLLESNFDKIYNRDGGILREWVEEDEMENIICETIAKPDYINSNPTYDDQIERVKEMNDFVTPYFRLITEECDILGYSCEKVITGMPTHKSKYARTYEVEVESEESEK